MNMEKQLSMTPDAIRKRAKRAAEKAATQPQLEIVEEQAAPINDKEVQIVKVGHALLHHRDGTVTKDSIWGIARIGKHLVKFYGRRNATPRFRIEKEDGLDDALKLFELKKLGQDVKKLVHLELDAAAQFELLGKDFNDTLATQFFKAVVEGKVDRRAIDE
ncbi:hypothetical protein BG58_11145 [Caballeronia jiangsuensis]|nr:hypothetical protein BG58_11145 [Caballeronia jiangsuensis]